MKQVKHLFVVSFFLVIADSFPQRVLAQEDSSPFAWSSPEEVGMSSERLRHLVKTAQEWVDNDEIVGAVMLIIRHDKIILHEAVGWSDRENNIPMEVGNILQTRSMTKPLTGAAVLMLMEEGRLLLDDNISQYLPAFDNPRSQDITIYQLLTHTSGLPRKDPLGQLSRQRRGPPSVSPSLRSGADGHGRVGPSIEPGTEFYYSDRNARVLGALIEEISNMPAEEFIQKRILDPLQMNSSFFNHTRPDDQRRSRVAAAYRGEPGSWDKEFENSDLPLRQFLSPSWGLLSTGMDYAKFLSMMLNGGRFGTGQLLSPLTVKLATSPHSEYVYDAASLLGLRNQLDAWTFYGLHFRLTPSGAFGHGGGQGTLALADPQQDLIFIYLTQSRGHRTRWRFVNLVYEAIVE